MEYRCLLFRSQWSTNIFYFLRFKCRQCFYKIAKINHISYISKLSRTIGLGLSKCERLYISVVTIPPLYSCEVHIFTKYFSVCLLEPSSGKWCVKTSIATCRTLLHPHSLTIRIVSHSSGNTGGPGSLGFSHPAPGWPHNPHRIFYNFSNWNRVMSHEAEGSTTCNHMIKLYIPCWKFHLYRKLAKVTAIKRPG